MSQKSMPKLEVVPPQKTIIEEFPEYGFRPTSLLGGPTIRSKSYGRIPILVGGIALLASFIVLGFMIYNFTEAAKYEKRAERYSKKSYEYYLQGENELQKKESENEKRMELKREKSENLAENILLPIGIPLLYCGLICFALGCKYHKKYMPVKAVADYLSFSGKGKSKGMAIFVKDRKFGVLKTGFNEVVVPAEYDRLTWQSTKHLFGEVDGKILLVDAKGKQCTQPYDKLTWSSHKGVLLAELDGKDFLVDIYGNVLN